MLAKAVMIDSCSEKTRGLHSDSAALSMCTTNLNFTPVTLDANMNETSFCQNLLVDMIITPGKKKTKPKTVSCRNMLFIFS